jgi:hypothetical protein
MKRFFLILILIFTLGAESCKIDSYETKPSNTETNASSSELKITRHPTTGDFHRGKLKSLPVYNAKSTEGWQVDLRGYDLTTLDISNRLNDLMYADFDSKTKWPEKLPEGFNPETIMELGKNPGLGLKKLHIDGITGNGIGIAIIDQALLVDHEEYKSNLKMYEEIHWPTQQNESAQMHGPAVASIAVGKTIGVAPEADLYYIAEQHGEFKDNNFNWDFTWLAQSIDRILEVNKTLPKENKIRAISISAGWDKSQKGYNEVTAAVNRAKENGIFVVSSSLVDTFGYFFNGLGRDSLSDPDKAAAYKPGLFWESSVYSDRIDDILLVPMDSRTTASPTGNNDYVFYKQGGWSWSIPYIAGLYTLACQVDPEITPQKFWEIALNTGNALTIKKDGKDYYVGKIANPEKLIKELKK